MHTLLAHCSMRRTDSLKPEATSGGHWQPASLSRTCDSIQQHATTNGRGGCLFDLLLDGNGPIIPATFKIDASRVPFPCLWCFFASCKLWPRPLPSIVMYVQAFKYTNEVTDRERHGTCVRACVCKNERVRVATLTYYVLPTAS